MTVFLVIETRATYGSEFAEKDECVCVCATKEKALEVIKEMQAYGRSHRIEPMEVVI